MSTARVRPALGRLSRRDSYGPEHRITTCSACGLGIYRNQARRWSRQPLGLVHDDCTGETP